MLLDAMQMELFGVVLMETVVAVVIQMRIAKHLFVQVVLEQHVLQQYVLTHQRPSQLIVQLKLLIKIKTRTLYTRTTKLAQIKL